MDADNCLYAGEGRLLVMTDEKKPTAAQIKYAYDLIDKLGYDRDDYDFEKMTRQEAIKLIAKLKREWEG